MIENNLVELDLNSLDPEFKRRVAARPGGQGLMRCYACGACSARCPISELHEDFDPRRMIRLVILGAEKEVLAASHLWFCATCFTCQETCPQGVGFTEVLFALKNMAVEAGCFPPALAAQPELLKTHGRLYEISEFENKKRGELGLPPLPERPGHFQVLLKNFRPRAGEEDK